MRPANQFYRTSFLVAIFVGSLILFSRAAHAIDFSRQDQRLHIAAGFGGTILTYGVAKAIGWDHKKSLWTGIFLSMTAGVLKELTDKSVDEEDLQADALGTALGASVTIVIHEW
ncbi:MAG: hypothetical protein ABL958_00600 [Bdellovibrionia bacterium]